MIRPAGDEQLTVLIASPLEARLVERIAAVAPDRIRVLHHPELLPRPRYEGDHHGDRRDLSSAELERWRSLLREADILFDFDWYEPEQMPVNAPNLRWVQATSAGIGEYLARTGLAQSSIAFTTAAGTHAVPLAEHVILGLLYLTKRVPELLAWQAQHRWDRFTTNQLAGKRVMIVGLGNVGREVAVACERMGLEVWALRHRPDSVTPNGVSRLVDRADLHAALRDVDAVVLACPYTPETHHLVGRAEFDAMRRGTMFVNIARGAVVDEPELIAALGDGRVGGAVLDVFETEPLPRDNPLWDMPNVLISPHSASTVPTENEYITGLFADNLRRYLAGESLRNLFVADRGY